MSFPPPPGLKTSRQSSGSSTPQPHPSLPARPPPSAASSFKPAFSNSQSSNRGPSAGGHGNSSGSVVQSSNFNSFAAFKPQSVASPTNNWKTQTPSISAAPTYQSNPQVSYAGTNYPHQQQQQQQQQQQRQQQYQSPYNVSAYQQNGSNDYTQAAAPPQIQNPFPLPGQAGRGPQDATGANYDPAMEAQIAQWQSAYMSKDDAQGSASKTGNSSGPSFAGGANAVALATRPNTLNALNNQDSTSNRAEIGPVAPTVGADGKEKTVARSGGGESWQDSSLLEWDPAHFRLFAGNLAGEVTDESLLKAFSKYDSVQKARVVRDKRTTKSKGYGFVSFSNGDDYFQAAKEMQGKYIGSHPVLLRRSTTEIIPTSVADKNRHKGKGGAGKRYGKDGDKANVHGANTGAGVHKKPSKTKGGLKILG